MKKIKQKKKSKKVNKATKTTIVPKMSIARQQYIKRFRRSIIRRANKELKAQIFATHQISKQKNNGQLNIKRKMTIDDTDSVQEERRVRFDEESNETYENPRWIEEGQQDQQPEQKDELEKIQQYNPAEDDY